jgi:hypothetical protein
MEKKRIKVLANHKSDWVSIKTANPNQRFKIRYSYENDGLTWPKLDFYIFY